MVNVYDLHFKKEILPLFDCLHNEQARNVLLELMTEMPQSAEEIYGRQAILKALLRHDPLYRAFSYSKIEFNQVYTYIEEKKVNSRRLTGASLRAHLLFARAERNREKGGLYGLLYFFHKVSDFYFSRLKMEFFPEDFGRRVKKIMGLLAKLEIEKYYALARGRGLGLKEVAALVQTIQEKVDNGEMDAFWKDFFIFEAWYSISRGIHEQQFTFPVFREGEMSITEFYHPLLKYPVRNSLDVKDAVTLITGPNMSGKSTLLKSIGLCVYLAHLGLAVPAEQCAIPFFEVISIAINLNDDIKNGYSHFMTEIKVLKKVLVEARNGRRCFAVFDELFRGTNIEDALAISRMTIKGLTAFPGSIFFISTHLHQLEQATGWNSINACYIDCALEEGMPVFTYKVKPGWSDLKLGQIIFKREGLYDLLAGNG